MKRTCTLTLCVGSLLLAACGSDDGSSGESTARVTEEAAEEAPPELRNFTVGVFPGAFHSLVQHVAVAEGMFEDVGLDVDLVETASGPEAIAALASKSIDVMINSPGNQMLANAEGQDIVGIIGGLDTAFYTWVAQQDWPTPNAGEGYPAAVEDLKGAQIGVTARGAETELFTREFLVDAGLDPDKDVSFVQVGIGPQAIGAFKAGQIDVLVGVEPAQTLLIDVEGIGKAMFDLRKGEGPERFALWPALSWQALRSEADAEPELFTSFQEALVAAFDYMHDPANKDRVIEIYGEVIDLDQAALEAIYENNIDTVGPTFDCEAYENVVGFMIDTEQLTEEEIEPCHKLMWEGAVPYIENYTG